MAATKKSSTKRWTEEAYKRMQERSSQLLDADDYDAAAPLIRDSLAAAKQLYGDPHTEIASCLYNSGVLERSTGRSAQAMRTFAKALAMYEALGDHASIADVLERLASIRVGEGAYKEARRFADRGLAVCRAEGLRDVNYGVLLAHLAKCELEEGDNGKARSLFTEAVAVFEEAGVPDNATAARVSRGTAARRAGDFAAAIADYRAGLEEEEGRLGLDDPELVSTIDSLAGVLTDSGDAAAAEPLLLRLLALHEATQPVRWPEIAHTCNALGCVVLGRDLASAKAWWERAKATAEEHGVTGELASALGNLSSLADADGDITQAAALAERAIPLAREGGDAETLEAVLYRRAAAHVASDEAELAVPLMKEAVRIRRGERREPLMLVRDLLLLGIAERDSDDSQAAHKTLDEALALAKKHGAEDGEDVMGVEAALIALSQGSEDLERELALLRARLDKLRRTVGRVHALFAETSRRLGEVLYELDREYDAIAFLTDAVAIYRQLDGHESLEAVDALERCAHAFSDVDDHGAGSMYREVLAIREKVLGADHIDVGWALSNLAIYEVEHGSAEEAVRFAERAVEIGQRAVRAAGATRDDDTSDALAEFFNTLGRAHADAEQWAQADDAFMRAIEMRESLFGKSADEVQATVDAAAEEITESGSLARCPRLAARHSRVRAR